MAAKAAAEMAVAKAAADAAAEVEAEAATKAAEEQAAKLADEAAKMEAEKEAAKAAAEEEIVARAAEEAAKAAAEEVAAKAAAGEAATKAAEDAAAKAAEEAAAKAVAEEAAKAAAEEAAAKAAEEAAAKAVEEAAAKAVEEAAAKAAEEAAAKAAEEAAAKVVEEAAAKAAEEDAAKATAEAAAKAAEEEVAKAAVEAAATASAEAEAARAAEAEAAKAAEVEAAAKATAEAAAKATAEATAEATAKAAEEAAPKAAAEGAATTTAEVEAPKAVEVEAASKAAAEELKKQAEEAQSREAEEAAKMAAEQAAAETATEVEEAAAQGANQADSPEAAENGLVTDVAADEANLEAESKLAASMAALAAAAAEGSADQAKADGLADGMAKPRTEMEAGVSEPNMEDAHTPSEASPVATEGAVNEVAAETPNTEAAAVEASPAADVAEPALPSIDATPTTAPAAGVEATTGVEATGEPATSLESDAALEAADAALEAADAALEAAPTSAGEKAEGLVRVEVESTGAAAEQPAEVEPPRTDSHVEPASGELDAAVDADTPAQAARAEESAASAADGAVPASEDEAVATMGSDEAVVTLTAEEAAAKAAANEAAAKAAEEEAAAKAAEEEAAAKVAAEQAAAKTAADEAAANVAAEEAAAKTAADAAEKAAAEEAARVAAEEAAAKKAADEAAAKAAAEEAARRAAEAAQKAAEEAARIAALTPSAAQVVASGFNATRLTEAGLLPPSQRSLNFQWLTRELGGLVTSSDMLTTAVGLGSFAVATLLLDSRAAQMALASAATRAMLVPAGVSLSTRATTSDCSPIGVAAQEKALIDTGTDGDDSVVDTVTVPMAVANTTALADGCTPLCAMLQLPLANVAAQLASSPEVATRILTFIESLALFAGAHIFASSAAPHDEATARHIVLTLLLAADAAEPPIPPPSTPASDAPWACAVGAPILPALLLAFFGFVRSGRMLLACIAFGAVLCVRPLFVVFVPFVVVFLGATAGMRQLVPRLLALAAPALVSLIPWLSAAPDGTHAAPSFSELLVTLRPPLVLLDAPLGAPSPHSVWGVYDTFSGSSASEGVSTEALLTTVATLMLLPLVQLARKPHPLRLATTLAITGTASLLVLPRAAPLLLPLLLPLLRFTAAESRSHARAYLVALASVLASSHRTEPMAILASLMHLLLANAALQWALCEPPAAADAPSPSGTPAPKKAGGSRSLFPSLWKLFLALLVVEQLVLRWASPGVDGALPAAAGAGVTGLALLDVPVAVEPLGGVLARYLPAARGALAMLLVLCLLLGAVGDTPHAGWSGGAWSKGLGQLDDAEEFIFNEKHKVWMPRSADPDLWVKDNSAAPPPPPGGGGSEGNGGHRNGNGGASTPMTPHPSGPMTPGSGAPAGGPGRFSARSASTAKRPSARSRYVDTLNPMGGGDEDEPAPSTLAPNLQNAADEALIDDLRAQLDAQKRQLVQHQSREFAHAQEVNALREELLQATLGEEIDVSVPPPPQGAEVAMAAEPQPSYMPPLGLSQPPTPPKCTLSTLPDEPVHVATPAGGVRQASHTHVPTPQAAPVPLPAVAPVLKPVAPPPSLMVLSQPASPRGRAPSPTGRAVQGVWVPPPAGRSLTPRGSARKVLQPVVPFDASGRAPSPRRSDR